MIRIAKTENGVVRGLPSADARITVYKGIPFAAPPVGENRWRAPQKCEDWEGIKDAYEYAPIPMQDTPGLGTDVYCSEWHVDPDIPMSEDCLYLNVWTPAKSTDEKLPVLVWIYGGAFQWGYTAEMEFDGERLAKRGIVVVTVAYRLGAFGFMAHPDITKAQPDAPTNFGALDQQAGLMWVVRNIAAFGGDPDNISIGGQSAGGASTMAQITSEGNYPYIKSASIFSGIIRNPYWVDKFFIPGTLKDAEKKGIDFLNVLGVSTIEEARGIDASVIRDKYAEYREKHVWMSICVDGKFLTGEPLSRLANNECADIPLFVGNTLDEFIAGIQADSVSELREKSKEIFGDKADDFLDYKQATTPGELGYGQVSSLEAAIKAVMEKRRECGNDKDCYYYKFASDIPGDDNPGTFHSVDLWFFFETLAKSPRAFVGRHYDLARKMCNYWTNFIKSGNPNGNDSDKSAMPLWKPYTEKEQNEMVFKSEGPVLEIHEDAFNDFIKDYTRSQL